MNGHRGFSCFEQISSRHHTVHIVEQNTSLISCSQTEDPDIIVDLRVDNTGRPCKYQTFLERCNTYLESSVETSVDDRRYDIVEEGENGMVDVVTHLAKAFRVRDLHEQVSKSVPP